MVQYLSTFVVGFEEVAKEALKKTFKDIDIQLVLDGAILYQTTASISEVQKVKFLNNSFLVLHYFKKVEHGSLNNLIKFIYNSNWMKQNSIPSLPGARTFRVIASRENQIGEIELNIQRNIEEKIAKHTRMTVDRAGGDCEYWFIERSEGVGFFTLRLTRSRSSHKDLKPGELRSELSNLLCALSEPSPEDIFIDPFAGSGAIARERLNLPHKKIMASDIDLSRINKVAGVDVFEGDATKLDEVKDGSVNKIVTDPPWGLADREIDVEDLYKKSFGEFDRILKSNGVLVILTSRKLTVEKLLDSYPNLKLERRYDVLVNGKKAGVFKLRKS